MGPGRRPGRTFLRLSSELSLRLFENSALPPMLRLIGETSPPNGACEKPIPVPDPALVGCAQRNPGSSTGEWPHPGRRLPTSVRSTAS